MIKVIVDDFCNKIDNTLNFLSSSQTVILTQSEKMDNGLWKYYFAYFKVNLLIFEDLDFFNPSPDSYILEYIDSDVDYS